MLDTFKKSQERAIGWERGSPVEGLDEGFWQSFWDSREEYLSVANSEAELRNQFAYAQSVIDRVRATTGKDIPHPMSAMTFKIGAAGLGYGQNKMLNEWRQAHYDPIRAQFPELGLPALDEPDIIAGGETFGRSAVRDAKDKARKRVTSASGWGAFAGQMAGAFQDPVNVAVNIVTAPISAGEKVLKAFGVGGVIGGASQGAVTALNYDYRKRIDPEYTLSAAMEEVASAAAVGGAIQGGVAGITKGLGYVKPRRVRDAENIVEREKTFAKPFSKAAKNAEAAPKHKAALEFATDQLENRRRVQLPQELQPSLVERASRVIDSDGNEVAVNYEVVEARDLITSHTNDLTPDPRFPQELQPRARERVASQDQINAIASDLRPEWLGPSPKSDSGAPIVGADNLVESGNGRVLGIRRAYQRGTAGAQAYRDFLRGQGFDVEGMSEPVLVARRSTDLAPQERVQFVQASNRATVARMGASEQALADARLIDGGMLEVLDKDGAFSASFARKLFQSLPAEERANLMDAGGVLSRDGQRRIEGALLGRAYGDAQFLGRALESTDNNIKTIANSLQDASGKWAMMRDGVANGTLPAQMDITDDLLSAVKIVMNARDKGLKMSEALSEASADMFNPSTPFTGLMVKNFFKDDDLAKGISRAKLTEFLKDYAEEALKNTTDARLFGDALDAGDVLQTALKKAGREDLLGAAEQALKPENIEKLQDAPEVADAVVMEANRAIAQELTGEGPPLKFFDDDGVERNVADMFDELDQQIEAADKIQACATGTPQAQTGGKPTTVDPIADLAETLKAPKQITMDADGNVTGLKVVKPDGTVAQQISVDADGNIINGGDK